MFDYTKQPSDEEYYEWNIVKRLGLAPNAFTPEHSWSPGRQSISWFPSDTKENFDAQPQSFKDLWENKHFTYNVNRWGFRCKEFEDVTEHYAPEDIIITLGCSFTFGIGVAEEDIFTYQIAKDLNKAYINLGVPGAGLDTAFRVYSHWQPLLKAGTTIVTTPPNGRIEALHLNPESLTESYEKLILRNFHSNFGLDSSEELKIRMLALLDPLMDTLRREQALQAIDNVARQTGSKLFVISPYRLRVAGEHDIWKTSKGRDNAHPGHEWHRSHADGILQLIRENKYYKSDMIDNQDWTFSVQTDHTVRQSIEAERPK